MTTPDPRRTGISWTTLTGWSGVVFVVVFLASIMFVADGPTLNDSAADLRRWFEDNEAQVAWTTWSGGLSLAVFFLVFASGLRSLLGLADASDEGVWARLSFAGAVLIVAIGGVKAAFWAVLGLEDLRSAASDETIKTLAAFDPVIVAAILPWAVAVFLLGASLVILRSGVMARWLGWLGVGTAVLLVIGMLWPFTGDPESFLGALVFLGFIGWLMWTLAAAIGLIRSDMPPAT